MLAGRLTALSGVVKMRFEPFFSGYDRAIPVGGVTVLAMAPGDSMRFCGVSDDSNVSRDGQQSDVLFFLLRLSVSISTRPIATGVFLTFVEFCEAAIV